MSFSPFALTSRILTSCALLSLGSCTTATSTVQVRTDGRVRVVPEEFTVDAGCSFSSGDQAELSHYVVSLVDLGPIPEDGESADPPDTRGYPKLIASAAIARCTSSLTFSTSGDDSVILMDHRYAAVVDGYLGAAPRLRRERSAENWPEPNWQWVCGVGGLAGDQLEWLAERATQLPLGVSDPVVPARDAGPGAASSDAATTVSSDAAFVESTPTNPSTTSDGGNPYPDGGSTPETTSSAFDASPFSTAITFETGAADSGPVDGGTPNDTAESATNVPSSGLPSDGVVSVPRGLDGGSDAAVVEPSTAVTDSADAGPPPTDADTTPLSRLTTAANIEGFPGPAEVHQGGQSGVRGCVPLF